MDKVDEKVGIFFTQLKGYDIWKSQCHHIDLDKIEMKEWVMAVYNRKELSTLRATALLRMNDEWRKHLFGIAQNPTQVELDEVAGDNINPDYYTDMKITPREFIVANDLDWDTGNVIKYVCRWKGKNGLEDLEKARRYIDFLIEQAKG